MITWATDERPKLVHFSVRKWSIFRPLLDALPRVGGYWGDVKCEKHTTLLKSQLPVREPARSFRFGCIYYSIHPNRNDREKTSPPSGNDHSCAPPSSRILGGAGVCGLIYTFISRPRSLDSRGMIRGMMPPEKTPKNPV